MSTPASRLLAALLLALAAGRASAADAPAVSEPQFSSGWRFEQRSGAAIYGALCAACHMPDGRGARGAAAYPALQGNAKLASAPYLLHMIVNGNRAMPGFGSQLSNEQIAAVASHVRQRFASLPTGEPAINPADVQALRPAPQSSSPSTPAASAVAH
ncbi:cytochrome c [Paucibacter sp. APW11]|uniref:Cytochrome c n=1 Tax=Roseateles aquae TaxID=3077235 RepID=A0ABU3PJR7_9BURK|nr:cytochrome c [Paucibacter sp. APW11]MDT9002407.1 cytochrome c [Paucibacter sp. APW11]